MSEPLFAALLLGALAAAIRSRESTHRWRWVLLAGVLGGLTILTRANALVLLLPLGLAVWTGQAALLTARARRPRRAGRARAADRLPVDDPQRGRLRPLHPGLHPARIGARGHLQRAGARPTRRTPPRGARSGHVPSYRALYARLRFIPEPEVEDHPDRAVEGVHPQAPRVRGHGRAGGPRCARSSSAGWTGRATPRGRSASPPAGPTPGSSASGSSPCSPSPARRQRPARRTPFFVWLIPILLYLSVVFLVVETPRYRTGIDPFIVMLAALALRRALPGAADRELPPPDRARYPTSPKAPTPA